MARIRGNCNSVDQPENTPRAPRDRQARDRWNAGPRQPPRAAEACPEDHEAFDGKSPTGPDRPRVRHAADPAFRRGGAARHGTARRHRLARRRQRRGQPGRGDRGPRARTYGGVTVLATGVTVHVAIPLSALALTFFGHAPEMATLWFVAGDGPLIVLLVRRAHAVRHDFLNASPVVVPLRRQPPPIGSRPFGWVRSVPAAGSPTPGSSQRLRLASGRSFAAPPCEQVRSAYHQSLGLWRSGDRVSSWLFRISIQIS